VLCIFLGSTYNVLMLTISSVVSNLKRLSLVFTHEICMIFLH